MKTVKENIELFEEARRLRSKLKEILYQNANNTGYCSVKFNSNIKTNLHKRLIELDRQKKQRRLRKK